MRARRHGRREHAARDVRETVTGVVRHATHDARERVNGIRRDMSSPSTTAMAAGLAAGAGLAMIAAARSAAHCKRVATRSRGKTVLITGASRGLGLVLARQFAAEGAHVAILARGGAALADAAQELRAKGADIDAFEADISKPAEAERAVHRLISRWGRIDVLVNNAGRSCPRRSSMSPSRTSSGAWACTSTARSI